MSGKGLSSAPGSALTIDDLVRQAGKFRSSLAGRRKKLKPSADFWYPWDILANLQHISELLSQEDRDLTRLIRDLPVADVGCGDGDLGFLLEDCGIDKPCLIDHPTFNQNQLQGARLLKKSLRSHAQIHEIDLDGRFEFPHPRFGLVFALGLLYHLRNPFYFLETLSGCADYCFLSTRLARFDPSLLIPFGDLPIAYLLGPRECNDDATNYWIFSPEGMRRLLQRTGWRILTERAFGPEASDPVSPEGDQRGFYFLENSAKGTKPTREGRA